MSRYSFSGNLAQPNQITARGGDQGFGPKFPAPNFDLNQLIGTFKVTPFDLEKVPLHKFLTRRSIHRLEWLHDLKQERRIHSMRASEGYQKIVDQNSKIIAQIEELEKEEKFNSRIDHTDEIKLLKVEEEALGKRVTEAFEKVELARFKWERLGRLERNIHDSLVGLNQHGKRNHKFEDILEVPKIEGLAGVVELRDHLAELRTQRRQVESAPIPSTDAKRIAKEQIVALADLGKPDVLATLHESKPVDFFLGNHSAVISHGVEHNQAALAVVAWAMPEALLKAINAEIDASADDQNALTPAEKEEALQDIDAAILSAERAEVEAVLNSDGRELPRENTNFLAFLGVELVSAESKAKR